MRPAISNDKPNISRENRIFASLQLELVVKQQRKADEHSRFSLNQWTAFAFSQVELETTICPFYEVIVISAAFSLGRAGFFLIFGYVRNSGSRHCSSGHGICCGLDEIGLRVSFQLC